MILPWIYWPRQTQSGEFSFLPNIYVWQKKIIKPESKVAFQTATWYTGNDNEKSQEFIHGNYKNEQETKDKSYKKTKEKILPIAKKVYKDYPKFVKRLKERHIDYNNQISLIRELEKNKEVLVIEPSKKLKISRLDKNMKNIIDAYNQGRIDAGNKLKDIKRFLKK